MKKIFSVIILALIAVFLCSCGCSNDSGVGSSITEQGDNSSSLEKDSSKLSGKDDSSSSSEQSGDSSGVDNDDESAVEEGELQSYEITWEE